MPTKPVANKANVLGSGITAAVMVPVITLSALRKNALLGSLNHQSVKRSPTWALTFSAEMSIGFGVYATPGTFVSFPMYWPVCTFMRPSECLGVLVMDVGAAA